MIMEPLGVTLAASAVATLLGPIAVFVHLVIGAARSPHRPERAVLCLGTALSAFGAATLVFTLLIAGISLGRSDAPDSSIPDSVTYGVLGFTFGPAVLILAGAVLAAVRRATTAARLLAAAPVAGIVLLVIVYVGAALVAG
jgi:hypothetical protein